jgi:hypothetical protein
MTLKGYRAAVALGLGACLIAAAYGVRSFARRPAGPPLGVVSPKERDVAGKWPVETLTTTYTIKNIGGADLVFGEFSTSCGCSIASIEPRRLRPGEVALVTVNGTPPSSGTKAVHVAVKTNSPTQPEISMSLRMTGTAPVPYIVTHNGPISFGRVRKAGETAFLYVETREEATESAWIDTPRCSPPNFEAVGGLVKEVSLGNGVVLRRYEYTASLRSLPDSGDLVGEIDLFGKGDTPRAIVKIPMTAHVKSPISVSPKAIFSNIQPHASAMHWTLRVSSEDDLDLKIEPDPGNDDLFAIHLDKPDRSTVLIEVGYPAATREPRSTRLRFRTNHPGLSLLEIPVSLRISP